MKNDFKNVKRLVIKIGSSLLVEDKKLREKWLGALMKDVGELLSQGVEIVVVSSGAIALGKIILKKDKLSTIAQKQAAAALGQIQLMSKYRDAAKKFDFNVAQILLTSSDCNERERYNNLQNVFGELLKNKIVPIINENDSVAIDEIKIGDNDRLAARVAQMISADLLVLFSDIDGLYDKNPKVFSDAKLIGEVKKITKDVEEMAGGAVSSVGTGGMITKITAAKMASLSGLEAVITSGLNDNCLTKLFLDKQNYTIFRSDKNAVKSRKKWLSGFLNAKGEVVVNECAKTALLEKNVSLLPIGIVKINGNFKKNELIFIKDESGNHIANGIANYDSVQAQKVLGKNSVDVKKLLGVDKTELVHIDNLVMI